MRTLNSEDVRHFSKGANFLACHIDPAAVFAYEEMIVQALPTGDVRLINIDELDPNDLVVALGFVTQGLAIADMPPVGDEFVRCIQAIEQRLGRKVSALYSLAAGNINGILPLMTGLQTGLPIVDSDPMGRVLPLISQTTLTLGGVRISPIAVTGVTGEHSTLDVEDPQRAETLVRSLVIELGGWAATAMYPCTGQQLAEHGIHGTMTRMIKIGEILGAEEPVESKYVQLMRLLNATRVARARVKHMESFSRDKALGLPTQTTSLTLVAEQTGQIIRLEIGNEILLVLVDGAVAAAVPDIITLLSADLGQVVNLDDVRVGQLIDIFLTPAAPIWYTEAGLNLAGPPAFGLQLQHPRCHA
ncbi:DUF917 domain-containing protein [Arthrobacter cryoconiti]|uniref:DUF917 domain-containing protein n=1 Tax=Arthrobacter cryoconiti TaxID=748907 RepID=A0ABV8R4E0_9MICC|nr:DUF917 domain-containing protein [Arthrobacter cryoconiti]MCC9066769.1 DUF917 domain-containing protein [Arthrobacter cryoconiti]